MFQATLCATCHRFGGEGGSVGPDLSTVAGRFTARDLAESILEPSKIISDQYAFSQITRTDGTSVIGKIIEEKQGKTVISSNPFDLGQTFSIPTESIRDKKPSPVSPMPAALIHSLNEQELRDFLAYLLGS
jgi:putative heme-binding domain-containing protein